MKRSFIAIFLTILLFPSIALAATIHVPGDYATIQAGIDAASNGDTVLVAPGTYFENVSFSDKALLIMSSGGPESTIIDGGGGDAVSISLAGDVELRGLSMTNSDRAIYANGSYAVLKVVHCHIYLNNVAILTSQQHRDEILNCLITQNQKGYVHAYYGKDSSIANSTFADNTEDVIFSPGYVAGIKLNIINSILRGQITGNPENAVYLQYCNYDPTKLGTNVIAQEGCNTGNPLFVDPVSSDYNLQVGSPCINTGDPNAFYNDSDGTRNDMGYTGGSNLYVNTGSFDFGYVGVGQSKEFSIVIHNGKDTDIILSALYLGSPQLSTTASFPLTISPGSDETIPVSYNPTTGGPFESTVQINCDDLYGATFAVFAVTGYCVAYTGGVIHVPSEASTIQIAADVCTDGDIISIAPGTYYEIIYLYSKRYVIIGEKGAEHTIIDGGGEDAVTFHSGGHGELRGLSIINSKKGVRAEWIPPLSIIACHLHRNTTGISGGGTVEFQIINCLFTQNENGFTQGYYGENCLIVNSTFADNIRDVAYGPSYGTTVALNIVNSILRDVVTGTTDNPVYLNYCNYNPAKLGINVTVQEGCQTENPLFVDQINSNYRLQRGSPCIDAGTSEGAPSDDIEGTRRPQGPGYDIGAYELLKRVMPWLMLLLLDG